MLGLVYQTIIQSLSTRRKRSIFVTVAMEAQQALPMLGGEGETSYAFNSNFQRGSITKMKPIIEEEVMDLLSKSCLSAEYLCIADLGCSSGPNTLLASYDIINAITAGCNQLTRPTPGLQIFLSDLPGNDFNSIFKSTPAFLEKLKKENGSNFGPCLIAGMPGSFYDTLFPTKSMHFIHSTNSLHFLSRVPDGMVSEDGVQLNKGNIYLVKTTPSSVCKAYKEQFENDFTLFLKLRSKEIIPGGRIVLTLSGRRTEDPSHCYESCTMWEIISLALNDMVLEGLIEEEKLDSFNLPYYAASVEEIRELIHCEGSFHLNQLEIHRWDGSMPNHNFYDIDSIVQGKTFTGQNRAVLELMLASHFGKDKMDDLFHRVSNRAAEHFAKDPLNFSTIYVSMTKK